MWSYEKEKTGGAAFPFGVKETSENYEGRVEVTEQIEEGMTLRDYFAAKAMQALVAPENGATLIACTAYSIADAMLEARKK